MVTDVACNEDFRINPMPMVELLSCCLSFAQWDDTRVFAYEALDNRWPAWTAWRASTATTRLPTRASAKW